MAKNTIEVERYMEALHCFHWAYMSHFFTWFPGFERRSRTVMQRLEKRNKIRVIQYDGKKAYALKRKTKNGNINTSKVPHGLACTECLVRFYRARPDGEIIPERFFYGLGAVPEWGIRYLNGKMILLEYCTKSNFYFSGNIRGKLGTYKRYLEKIEEKFQAKAIVVFVLDVPRGAVERCVGSLGSLAGSEEPDEQPFFFTDYETFKKVPIGDQLKAPIYFWTDGKEYPLL